jgi:hypothetical protein
MYLSLAAFRFSAFLRQVYEETVPTTQDAAWHCDWDNERPGASCDLPEDVE